LKYVISCLYTLKIIYIIKSKLLGQKLTDTAYEIQMLKLVDSDPSVNIA